MKQIITLSLLFYCSTSFSQWTRVAQLPSSDIASLYHKGSILYAGGKNIIYVSKNNGLTWDSTSVIPRFTLVTSIIVYQNELYAAAPRKGVFKSPDGGTTWQTISAGNDTLDVSDFCEFKGELYASTFGNSVYKLNPVNRSSWLPFNSGLGSLSAVANAIACTSNTLIVGTNSNGLYDYLPANSTTWEERFLIPHVSVNEAAFDIITAHDTLFWPGKTGSFYMSTDNGLNWNLFSNRLVTGNNTLVNAKQALISSRYIFDGSSNTTLFYYIKKDSLQNAFANFSVVANHFTWKIDIVGDKLWDASDRGLFFMPLSLLPGITSADDSINITLQVNFISFNANCEKNKTLLTWETASEQNSSHFDIERSSDGISWTVVGSLPAIRNSKISNKYFFADNTFIQNSVYRIAEYDFDGRMQYSSVAHSSCNESDVFRSWPNPVRDLLSINITTGNESQATIKLFDSKGALVRTQTATVLQGNNQFTTNMKSLANGVYLLSVEWTNGKMKITKQVVKQ